MARRFDVIHTMAREGGDRSSEAALRYIDAGTGDVKVLSRRMRPMRARLARLPRFVAGSIEHALLTLHKQPWTREVA
jgi:hypothetical protein